MVEQLGVLTHLVDGHEVGGGCHAQSSNGGADVLGVPHLEGGGTNRDRHRQAVDDDPVAGRDELRRHADARLASERTVQDRDPNGELDPAALTSAVEPLGAHPAQRGPPGHGREPVEPVAGLHDPLLGQ